MKFHGPFFAIENKDGALRCNDVGDPYVFKEMGPHDNHTPHGRRVVNVTIVENAQDEPPIETELKRLKIRDRTALEWMDSIVDAIRPLAKALGIERPATEIDVLNAATLALAPKSIADDVRLTKLDARAEIGKPFEANATFEGEAVKAFAAHLIEWFRDSGGDNFVTLECTDTKTSQRFELTMQRVGGKSPAQLLNEMRAKYSLLEGKFQEPIDVLLGKLPHVKREMAEVAILNSHAELVRRVLIQCDWLGNHAAALDNLPTRIGGSGVDKCRMPDDIRRVVVGLRELLKDIYDADEEATAELKSIGCDGIKSKFKHRIEEALGLASTRVQS